MDDCLGTIDMGQKVWELLCPFLGGIGGWKLKQLQGASTDMEWPVITSLIITLEGKR